MHHIISTWGVKQIQRRLMISLNDSYKESLKRFSERILPAKSALVVTHDFPDPDSLGAASGIKQLLKHKGVETVDIAFAGFIGRAENRAMIELLQIDHLSLVDIDISSYEKIIIVDTVPQNGNISIDESVQIDAVLDHHIEFTKTDHFKNTLVETFPALGATSTLATLYLLLSNTPIPPKVATALFYGIKTDTQDMGRNYSEIDIMCYKVLFDLIDHKLLSKIEHPPREVEYLQLLHRASESLTTYGNFAYMHLGEVSIPDFIPEMADIFHSLKDLEWIVCSAYFNNQILYSIRSKREQTAGIQAHRLAISMDGSGGGHNTMSAGRIKILNEDKKSAHSNFKQKLFSLFGIDTRDEIHILDLEK